MPQVNSYTEATNPASGDWIYLDKSDGAGGYDPRKVSPSRFLLADGSVTMTGEFVTDVGTFQSNVADGATNKGFIFDAANGVTTGFRIAEFQAGGVEKAYIDKNGLIRSQSLISAANGIHVSNVNANLTQPSASVLRIGATGGVRQNKSTLAVVAPGADEFLWRVEAGTNAGTLKLVAYAGTSTTGVTIVDNVGSGST